MEYVPRIHHIAALQQSPKEFLSKMSVESEEFTGRIIFMSMFNDISWGGQYWSKRQTVFFTSVDPMNKEHRDPDKIDLDAPRLAWYHQKKWKKHQNTVYWVDIKLPQRKGFKFCQTRSNAIILYDKLPAFCIPKAIMMETGEIIYERVHASPRPPPKISFKTIGGKIGFRSCWRW